MQLFHFSNTNGQCNTNPNSCTGECSWSVSTTECINGVQTITRTPATLGGSPICTPPPGTNTLICNPTVLNVPCGNLGFELPFFAFVHFVASALIIALIYVVLLVGIKKE